MPLPALRPAMSPPRTAVPTIRASVLLAAIGMAASPGVAASPADPAGWTFSGDVRGGYFASERTARDGAESRSEEHTSELQSLMRISYAVFCLKKKTKNTQKYSLVTATVTYQYTINIKKNNAG